MRSIDLAIMSRKRERERKKNQEIIIKENERIVEKKKIFDAFHFPSPGGGCDARLAPVSAEKRGKEQHSGRESGICLSADEDDGAEPPATDRWARFLSNAGLKIANESSTSPNKRKTMRQINNI